MYTDKQFLRLSKSKEELMKSTNSNHTWESFFNHLFALTYGRNKNGAYDGKGRKN